MTQTGDDGTHYDDAPLCLCCEQALAQRLPNDTFLADPDLSVPACGDCGIHLYRAFVILEAVPGIRGCAALGPDSGKGVRP